MVYSIKTKYLYNYCCLFLKFWSDMCYWKGVATLPIKAHEKVTQFRIAIFEWTLSVDPCNSYFHFAEGKLEWSQMKALLFLTAGKRHKCCFIVRSYVFDFSERMRLRKSTRFHSSNRSSRSYLFEGIGLFAVHYNRRVLCIHLLSLFCQAPWFCKPESNHIIGY